MNIKTFYQWIHYQKNRNDLIGDLAKDILIDNNFPRYVRVSYCKIEKYLKSRNASINAINSFKIAWEEYKSGFTALNRL